MKRGILVVNDFLKNAKFSEIYDFLIKAAKERDINITMISNADVLSNVETLMECKPDFAIFWDKDIKAASLLEKCNVLVFNSARAIAICDDKSLTYLELMNSKVKMPKTFIGPLTFGIEDKEHKTISAAERAVGYPMVIKENKGSFGAQVYLANDRDEAEKIIDGIAEKGYVIQEYVKNSSGRDIRMNMVGDRCVAAMKRVNDNDFRANVTNGGRMERYTVDDRQLEMARKVMRTLKLDFAGVDILFGENEEPVFCEVNSNAHFKNIYDCTGVNVAEYIMDYILDKIKTYDS